MELKPFNFNNETNRKRAVRRPTQPSPFIISGEHVTAAEAAKRLGIGRSTFDSRRRTAVMNLKPGEKVTWEMLTR